jgi:branched-chain amino acid transport system ATP-binding protein
MLKVERVSKSFDGFKAVSQVSMEVKEGKICSVIGTNGAGKTTLFNLITGHIHPDEGEIYFKDGRITRLSPHAIVKLGIGRSFQCLNIFPMLTAFENVQAAVISHKGKSLDLLGAREHLFKEETESVLEEVHLSEVKDERSGSLSYGYQKQLELGIALAFEPELLMLDEPTSGLAPSDTRYAMELIVNIARDRKTTLLVVEHDMQVVFSISEHIVVLHQGEVIADGLPEEVRKDIEVQKCYLGENV